MKLRVAFTRRSNFDIDDLDFLTEALLQEASPVRTADRALERAKDALAAAETDEERAAAEDEVKKAEAAKEAAKEEVKAMQKSRRATKARKQAERDTTDVIPVGKPKFKAIARPRLGAKISKRRRAGQKKIVTAASKSEEQAANGFMGMMERIGNSLSGFFNILTEWLKGLPTLASRILKPLKTLWEKIKAWGSKYHIFYRAKRLSMATVYCVGFIAAMVGSWIYRVIYGKDSKQSKAALDKANTYKGKIQSSMYMFQNPDKFIPNPGAAGATKTSQEENKETAETAIFIEAFGEILREDSNGGVFMATAGNFIKNTCNSGKIDAICKVADNSNNVAFKKLSKNLSICTKGPNAIIQSNGRLLPTNLNAETRFDDSLPALYESIIREAQAHKIKEIKKKAIKKVAMKKARSKKSLRGRM